MEARKGCENCGNYRCSQSPVAFYYDYCYSENMKYWKPQIQAVEDCLGKAIRPGHRSKRKIKRARRALKGVQRA